LRRGIFLRSLRGHWGKPIFLEKLAKASRYHGIWGSGDDESKDYTWKTFAPLLNQKDHYIIKAVDYTKENAFSFDNSAIRKKLTDNIRDALDEISDQKLAAQKVDVVSHSMGGLVVRSFCKDNPDACKRGIRKMITIDTPHFGTPLAQFLLDVAADVPLTPPVPDICGQKILQKFVEKGMPYDRGAVSALRPASPEINLHLGGNPSDLWAHPIIGLTPDGVPGYGVTFDLWNGIQHLCERTYDSSHRPDLIPLFGDDRSDRIVGSRSQEAFFGKTTRIEGVDHLNVHGNSSVVETVRKLLEEDPAAVGSSFEKGKF
jgi:hypothetical protein